MKKNNAGHRNRSFQSSAAGKGYQDRTTDSEAFRSNYDEINWGHSDFFTDEEMKRQRADRIKRCGCGRPDCEAHQ